MLLKNSPQKSAEKLFLSLVCLLRSISKDFSAGKRYFVEVVVNCVSVNCTVELVQLLVQGISRRLLQASLDVTVCINYMLKNLNRLQDLNFG